MISPAVCAKALQDDRRNEIMYHVGRPGHELLYHQRILSLLGIDGHNSHTNVCFRRRARRLCILVGYRPAVTRITPTRASFCC
jgi:hypothetical protein